MIWGPARAKCSSHTCMRGLKSAVIRPLEVMARGETAVFARNNVVNMVGKRDINLMQQAILTSLLGALHDAPTHRCWDVDGGHDYRRGGGGKTRTRFEEQKEVVHLGIDMVMEPIDLGHNALTVSRSEESTGRENGPSMAKARGVHKW